MIYSLTPPASAPRAVIDLPGSKSFTNRALIATSLADSQSILSNVSLSDDSKVLIDALKKFGVEFELAKTELTVVPPAKLLPFKGVIDVGPAGTSMRFLTALSSAIDGASVELRGSERMHKRPISDLVEALRRLGASIDYLGLEGSPPLKIEGQKLAASDVVELPGAVSSQFTTALLLIAPLIAGGLKLTITGERRSSSYVKMTTATMRSFGVEVPEENEAIYAIAENSNYKGTSHAIEPDATGAGYFFGVAALSAGSITIPSLSTTSSQGDIQLLAFLERMGCQIEETQSGITLHGPQRLRAVTADMLELPDSAQTLAVVAATANGTSTLTGLATLRDKETDRIEAVKNELTKCGVNVSVENDSLIIQGGESIHSTHVETYEDHRMAMSFAMLAAKYKGITIDTPDVVSKSFPNFWDKFGSLGIGVTCV